MMKREKKMSELRFSSPACMLAGKNRLTAADIQDLRTTLFPDGLTSSADAVVLLAINASCPQKCPEWAGYFIEEMALYIVQRSDPAGTIDETNAAWLKAMIAAGGVIRTKPEFDLLMRVIEMAASVPESLTVLALDQVRIALSDGAGFWAGRRGAQSGRIVPEDIALIYAVLSLRSKANRHFMTSGEIAVLRRIDDLSRNSATPPAWRELMRGIEVFDAASGSERAA